MVGVDIAAHHDTLQSMTKPPPRVTRTFTQILYGLAIHEQVRTLARQRGSLEHLFVLISFGDLLGLPILPPYYSMRLLPFVVPLINNWKRRMMRERDLMDAIF
jgi:hypothetical protein